MPTPKRKPATKSRRDVADMTGKLAALREMTVGQLRDEYRKVVGEPTRSRNKDYLRKKLAWHVQAQAEGGLSNRALALIDQLAPGAPIHWRQSTPRQKGAVTPPPCVAGDRDQRLPAPGTTITRRHEGEDFAVTVLEDGFEFRGERHRSLSKIAREISGTNWNGFLFFGLQRRGRTPDARGGKR